MASSRERESDPSTLVILAHQDDEYFVSARILREIASGRRVFVVFTTHGSVYGTPSEVRERESAQVLGRLGVPESQIRAVGREVGVPDGTAMRNVKRLREPALAAFPGVRFTRLITMAWEGGHPDHDATHLVAASLARQWGLESEFYEVPAYTLFGAPRFLFRVAKIISGRPGEVSTRIAPFERIRLFLLFRFYKSQWGAFLGLLPEAAFQFLVKGKQPLRKVNPREMNYLVRPHDGPLFYEKRFKIPFEAFIEECRDFIRENLELA